MINPKQALTAGRFLYGIGILAPGIHQIVIKDFRPDILPPFLAWAHKYIAFSTISGIVIILTGIFISGLIASKFVNARNT